MSVTVLEDRVLLQPGDLRPLAPDFEIIGVFNPGVARYAQDIILLVRVVEQPRAQDPGRLASPRVVWLADEPGWVVDTFPTQGAEAHDPRFFRLPDGSVRLKYISHLRLVRLDGVDGRIKEIRLLPDLLPRAPWEEFGIEDARITEIEGVYYITYVAISRQMGIATALMTTRDFQRFERHGIILPAENKDVVLLPERWQGHFVAYHRPTSSYQVGPPSIVAALSPDGFHWGRHQHLLAPGFRAWHSVKIGAGPPPVRTAAGWLLFYHEVAPPAPQSPVGEYCVGAVLLDGENPLRPLARSAEPLLRPERPYELQGFAPRVLFPTGVLWAEDRNSLLLFSGAADQVVTMLRLPVDEVLDCLTTPN